MLRSEGDHPKKSGHFRLLSPSMLMLVVVMMLMMMFDDDV